MILTIEYNIIKLFRIMGYFVHPSFNLCTLTHSSLYLSILNYSYFFVHNWQAISFYILANMYLQPFLQKRNYNIIHISLYIYIHLSSCPCNLVYNFSIYLYYLPIILPVKLSCYYQALIQINFLSGDQF